jgi:hypothetical protein
MKGEIESLIEQWFDGELDVSQQDELADWLKKQPDDMQKFVEANVRDQMLRDAAVGEFMADEVREITPTAHDSQWFANGRMTTNRIFAAVAAIATGLLITFALYQGGEAGIEKMKSFSSVAMIQDTGGNLKEGDRLGAETLEIKSGIVHLLFDDGVEVTLQGPAEYKLIAPGRTQLVSGLLTATVPPGAEGFRVDTPTAQVVDLGTAFGIEQRSDGTSKVSVFDGEVEVIGQNDSGKKRLLTEGQAIQLAADGQVSEAEFSTNQFDKLWPIASGIAGSTDVFEFAPQWPRKLRRVESDTKIFVLPEGYAKRLDEPCRIDMTGEESSKSVIPVGARVRSFLLQFNPLDSGGKPRRGNRKNFRRIEGSITFDRPVIGLIVEGDTLRETDEMFSLNRMGGLFGRGLELGPSRLADEISLSKDRRTLTLNLGVGNRLNDHVRVIVDAEFNYVKSTTSLKE